MMQIPTHGGVPTLPDEFCDERTFRARTVAALKELFRRAEAEGVPQNGAGRGRFIDEGRR
jgi:hypothetical protein